MKDFFLPLTSYHLSLYKYIIGQILKWSTRRDCKSLALALRRFESCSAHISFLFQKTFLTEWQEGFLMVLEKEIWALVKPPCFTRALLDLDRVLEISCL